LEEALIGWSSVLQLLNPRALTVLNWLDQIPSTGGVRAENVKKMEFLPKWNLLRSVTSLGLYSSFVVPYERKNGEDDASLFKDCFEKGPNGSRVELEMWLRTVKLGGVMENELLEGLGLSKISEDSSVRDLEDGELVSAFLKRKGDPNEWEQ